MTSLYLIRHNFLHPPDFHLPNLTGATELPDSEEKRTATLVLKGPCDTKEIYKGTLFNNSTYHEDQVENTGPVFSLTLQLPRYMEKQGFQGRQATMKNIPFSQFAKLIMLVFRQVIIYKI